MTTQLVTPIKVGETVYVLFGYSLMSCKVLAIGRKRFKVEGKAHTFHNSSAHFVEPDKVAQENELIAIVAEYWKPGQGGHRIDRTLYPSRHVPAKSRTSFDYVAEYKKPSPL